MGIKNIIFDAIKVIKSCRIYTHKREPFYELAFNYLKDCKTVLDLGAGSGDFIRFFKNKGFNGKIYTYEGNRKTHYSLKKQGIKAIYGKLPKIKFKDNFFDGIHASHILEHLYPEELYKTLIGIKRVLKKDGILVISTPILWEEFYSDLSHIKPYNPNVFIKYLCEDVNLSSPSHNHIGGFKLMDMVYRYNFKGYNPVMFKYFPLLSLFSILFFKVLKKIGIGYYEKTGYTIILKKL